MKQIKKGKNYFGHMKRHDTHMKNTLERTIEGNLTRI